MNYIHPVKLTYSDLHGYLCLKFEERKNTSIYDWPAYNLGVKSVYKNRYSQFSVVYKQQILPKYISDDCWTITMFVPGANNRNYPTQKRIHRRTDWYAGQTQ